MSPFVPADDQPTTDEVSAYRQWIEEIRTAVVGILEQHDVSDMCIDEIKLYFTLEE